MFEEAEVMAAIAPVSSFDPDYMDYYNFLEAIVRVVKARPCSEEEEKTPTTFESKLESICNTIFQRFYDEVHPAFEQKRFNFETERKYQPRMCVDDDGGDSDDDDLQ